MNVPLCEFQVRCVVNHGRRFPIQGLPFQTETMEEKPNRYKTRNYEYSSKLITLKHKMSQ